MNIRPTAPTDSPALKTIAEKTGVFKPHEIDALGEVLDDYFATNQELGHQSHTAVIDSRIVGFVYFEPVPMTDNTWDLWWIAVDPDTQGQGIGAKLMDFAENCMRKEGGRVISLDTSSTQNYEPTRKFYLKIGYQLWATLPDYYTNGDSKCIFGKQL